MVEIVARRGQEQEFNGGSNGLLLSARWRLVLGNRKAFLSMGDYICKIFTDKGKTDCCIYSTLPSVRESVQNFASF